MSNIPRDKVFDSTFSLLLHGYNFIGERCKKYNADLFETRIMGERTICMYGREAAGILYDSRKFRRRDAAPSRIKKTLFGSGGVQTLDGKEHRYRKDMFMSLMSPYRIQEFTEVVRRYWDKYLDRWQYMEEVILFSEVQEILCQAACKWAGVPLEGEKVNRRSRDLWSMVDAFGGVGPRHWRGRRARSRMEEWIESVIRNLRKRNPDISPDSPAFRIATYRGPNGFLLPHNTAAVELINLLRPIVAIAVYVVFIALALYRFPEQAKKFESDPATYLEPFVQEVRRYFPFTPVVGGRVASEFNWLGYRFREGQLVLLDVYGTNHDSRIWSEPEAFRSDRFINWEGSLYGFIPQGGNNYEDGHRCAGEWITIETMKVALDYLGKRMQYVVPEQDLHYSLGRIPTFPRSGFIIKSIQNIS